MFQYAFYLQLKKRNPLNIFLLDVEHAQECHNGFELNRVFHIDGHNNVWKYWVRKRHWSRLMDRFYTIKQKHSLEYDKDIMGANRLLARYEGFWQSEKYFLPVEQDVRKSFSFNMDLLNKGTQTVAKEISWKESVSVHIRRGDYINSSNFGVCSIDYYKLAMSFISEKISDPIFVFFSDDIDWVKENIPCPNAIYVSCNHGIDSWQDMYLMTQCKHNIIANSSFSWWGAWLNNNSNKIVIAPAKWFNYSPNYDILPKEWITL